jgi:hypothetical protein
VAVIEWRFTVEMRDGTEHKTVADQGDLGEWEDEEFGTPFNEAQRKPVLFSRYLAWSALCRDGVYAEPFKAFRKACKEVRETSAKAGDQVDPGKAAPPDAT